MHTSARGIVGMCLSVIEFVRAYVSACMRARVCVSEAQWRDNVSGNIKIEILNISGEKWRICGEEDLGSSTKKNK